MFGFGEVGPPFILLFGLKKINKNKGKVSIPCSPLKSQIFHSSNLRKKIK